MVAKCSVSSLTPGTALALSPPRYWISDAITASFWLSVPGAGRSAGLDPA
jgi:hypothetical protein